jgi:hypothetical protein
MTIEYLKLEIGGVHPDAKSVAKSTAGKLRANPLGTESKDADRHLISVWLVRGIRHIIDLTF